MRSEVREKLIRELRAGFLERDRGLALLAAENVVEAIERLVALEVESAVSGGASSGDVREACASSAPGVMAPPHMQPASSADYVVGRKVIRVDAVARVGEHADRIRALVAKHGGRVAEDFLGHHAVVDADCVRLVGEIPWVDEETTRHVAAEFESLLEIPQ